MHLPFTFATGEATLYQTGYPLHGFPDSFQGKAKGHKSKKGKLDKSCSDDLDPGSLLGALMSQDESVYVCRPDTEPKVSQHRGLLGEQQSDGCHVASPPGYDPLLATLDSLSLDAEEPCSNSELFSALENLGLNAEDLELLLLDERMIQVELGPSQVPTLCDLLTNNEILSYIHDSLESGTEAQGHSVSQPGTSDSQIGIPNAADRPHHGSYRSHCHPRAAPRASQLNGGHKPLLLESGHQWQPQRDQHPAPPQSLPDQLTTNRSYLPNEHGAFPPSAQGGQAGYITSGVSHYPTSQQLQGDHARLPCPAQSSASQPPLSHFFKPLEAYGTFTPLEPPHSKVREPPE